VELEQAQMTKQLRTATKRFFYFRLGNIMLKIICNQMISKFSHAKEVSKILTCSVTFWKTLKTRISKIKVLLKLVFHNGFARIIYKTSNCSKYVNLLLAKRNYPIDIKVVAFKISSLRARQWNQLLI
jgi:hypothetical protein